MKRVCVILMMVIAFSVIGSVSLAQENTVTVPDVAGLNVPQAAALLNRSGLNLGVQTPADNAGDTPPNTVVSQAIAPNTSVPYGTVVDLTVVLPPNARLIYDDNDFTLVNITPEQMTIPNLIFTSAAGTPATYPATMFWASTLSGNRCFQLWSVSRNEPKSLDECEFIDGWRTTNNPQYHFWTQANGVSQFAVQENGVQRAICPAAPPNSQDRPTRCEFYLAGGGRGDDMTPFVYFAYRENVIAFINTSQDRWMPTNANNLYNYNPAISVPGARLTFGHPDILGEAFRQSPGDITLLAPGQCIMYTLDGSTVSEPPEPCDVIAQRPLVAGVAFWIADFEVESVIDGVSRICPGAAPGRLTRCILRR